MAKRTPSWAKLRQDVRINILQKLPELCIENWCLGEIPEDTFDLLGIPRDMYDKSRFGVAISSRRALSLNHGILSRRSLQSLEQEAVEKKAAVAKAAQKKKTDEEKQRKRVAKRKAQEESKERKALEDQEKAARLAKKSQVAVLKARIVDLKAEAQRACQAKKTNKAFCHCPAGECAQDLIQCSGPGLAIAGFKTGVCAARYWCCPKYVQANLPSPNKSPANKKQKTATPTKQELEQLFSRCHTCAQLHTDVSDIQTEIDTLSS